MEKLARPSCVDDDQWAALSALDQRLVHACEADDHALAVGSAKELCEAVAKAIWLHRGRQFGSRTDLSELVKTAHGFVDRLPPHGAAASGATRQLAQTAMKLVELLGDLRNRAGTGHGRPDLVPLTRIDAEFAAGVARLWSRWILAHLDLVVAASPERAAADFRSSLFRRTEATARLALVNLPSIDTVDQRMVGVAVGQRAAAGTFVVFGEGVRAAVDSEDVDAWPPAYRAGVAEGLFLDRNGYLALEPQTVASAPGILDALPDRGADVLAAILCRVTQADVAHGCTTDDRVSAARALKDAARSSRDAHVRSLLEKLAAAVERETAEVRPLMEPGA